MAGKNEHVDVIIHDAEVDPSVIAELPRCCRIISTEVRGTSFWAQTGRINVELSDGNSGIEVETGEALVFDACCFYAHNEYEFGQWRPVCNQFGKDYLEAYHSYVKISEPKEDYDGRLDLYKLRFNTHVSALFTENRALREQMLNDIKDLVERYG